MLSSTGEYDGWSIVETLEKLLAHVPTLPTEQTFSLLDPVIARLLKTVRNKSQDAYLLERCLCLLIYVEDIPAGLERIRNVVLAEPAPLYEIRMLAAELGRKGSAESLGLITELAKSSIGSRQGMPEELVDAVAAHGLPESNRMLLSLVDPALPSWGVGPSRHIAYTAPGHIVDIAKKDNKTVDRLLELSKVMLSSPQRELLCEVYSQLGTEPATLAALDLIDDNASSPMPLEIIETVEHLLVARRPYGNSSNVFTMEPRDGTEVRKRLFAFAVDGGVRSKSAINLLGIIEGLRLDYGRPASEPRHPCKESGLPWPPLGVAASASI
jgi:hypothetical protein